MVNTSTVRKGDVYFLSHGGPPTIEQTHSAPYKAWEKFGKLISADPPKGIAVVSAHWENESDFKGSESVIVNSNSSNPLIYDFYGFPKHYYEFKFSSSFTPQLENSVLSALEEGGVSYTRANRGFDHGVWLPFKAALGESTTIPIIQISLPGSSDPGATIKLGKALSKIRDEGYSIVTTGQAVHNLRDLFSGRKMTYAKPFLNQLDNALSTENAISSTVDLLKSSLYKQAHPTNEHFYPIFAALGALSSDPEQREKKEEILFGLLDMSGQPAQDEGLGWAMWRWVSP
ncbi:uncharacterized protein I206_105997 [Kwoniella pini CBS 10737]|uniref:Extradiol ring-cleavage dioxygenase class III enzyme subunit B domain-containing protein n=1 Tax=Kwoniella pini CBS 10737 TaxID=1296096 RepID=A0A1B9I0R4_9TREE|nr:uncharacterized protein I206_04820 [Kwoniella pini CBS 10737]OCF49133.1 hypothetical protein I206_04820 [Kwoniella pini CBS 10737]